MKHTVEMRYHIGDTVRVKSDRRWEGVTFVIKGIDISCRLPENETYIQYQGMVSRYTSWSFSEPQLEFAPGVDLKNKTWDVKEGDVIVLDGTEWTITNMETKWTGGGWSGSMGSEIDPGTPHTFLLLEAGDVKKNYELKDDTPVNVIGHKQKRFV